MSGANGQRASGCYLEATGLIVITVSGAKITAINRFLLPETEIVSRFGPMTTGCTPTPPGYGPR